MSWFSRSKKAEACDLVWLTAEAKLKGIIAAIGDITNQASSMLIVVHFEQTLGEVMNALKQAGISHHHIDRLIRPSTFREPATAAPKDEIRICLSERIPATTGERPPDEDRCGLTVLVAERYPVPERDERVLKFAYSCGVRDAVRFCSSLDDALLKQFGADRVLGAVKRLAKDEASPIVAKAITSAIRSAQRKMKKRAIGDERVSSAGDWFTYNIRGHGVLH
jgi:preprotein translocase subunit SecA